jgi:outer membrane protein assembly factor BamB
MDRERVYVPLQGGRLVAVTRETGAVSWSTDIATKWPPLLLNDRLVVATSASIRALSAKTCDREWEIPFGELSAGLAAADGRIYAVTTDREAIALRAGDGSPLWKHTLDAAALHAPVQVGALVVISLQGSLVVALNAATGDVVWSRRLEGTLSPPVGAKDRVLVGSTTNNLYALDLKRGDDAWIFRTGGDVIGAAVDGDVVYFVSLDNILRALNRGTGNQQWKTVIPTRPAAPPSAFRGIVVLTGVAPRVDGYVGKTGVAQGSYLAPSDLDGSALIDMSLPPFHVAMVTITRDGRMSALWSQPMMMRDPATTPMTALPGRRLERERLPTLVP